MALLLMEGFDHMSTYTLFGTKHWNAAVAASSTPSINSGGRINGRCYRVTHNGSSYTQLSKQLPSTYATLIAGFAVKYSSSSIATYSDCFALSADGIAYTVRVGVTTAGKVQVKNSGGTTIATGSLSLVFGTYNYIEVKAFINGASGTVEVYVNGVLDIASTTGNFGSTNLAHVMLISVGTQFGAQIDWDDIYAVDTTGAVNNTYLGDVHVETIFPTGDGGVSQWTPNSGVNHYDRVNENSGTYPDDDTTYVSDATVGHRDTYVFGDLIAAASTIKGVQTCLYARKDDATLRQLAAVVRQGGVNYDGAVGPGLTTGYAVQTEIFESDPSTSTAWTVSGVNSAEFGVKVAV